HDISLLWRRDAHSPPQHLVARDGAVARGRPGRRGQAVSLVVLVKLAHALVGVWFVCGLVGRWATLAQAERADDVRVLRGLLRLSAVFEERMVIPGSAAVLVLGLLTAWMQGQPLLGFLQGAPTSWLLASLVLYLSTMALVPLVFLPRGKRFAAA